MSRALAGGFAVVLAFAPRWLSAQRFTPDVVDQRPTVVRLPRLPWADSLRALPVTSLVTIQFSLDAAGRVERGTVGALIESRPGLIPLVTDLLYAASFTPAKVGGRSVEIVEQMTIDLASLEYGLAPHLADTVAGQDLDEMPDFITRRLPMYPVQLRDAGVQGRVLIELIVRPDGLPDTNSFHVRAAPDDRLTQAALAALGASTFTPGRLRGRAVYAKISVPYDFKVSYD